MEIEFYSFSSGSLLQLSAFGAWKPPLVRLTFLIRFGVIIKVAE